MTQSRRTGYPVMLDAIAKEADTYARYSLTAAESAGHLATLASFGSAACADEPQRFADRAEACRKVAGHLRACRDSGSDEPRDPGVPGPAALLGAAMRLDPGLDAMLAASAAFHGIPPQRRAG